MASLIQLVCLAGVLVAVTALTDWRWALLIGSVVGFVVGYRLERRALTDP